jgi:serine/threonine protein phosphatase PrpC
MKTSKKQLCDYWEIIECTTKGKRSAMEDSSAFLCPFTSDTSFLVSVFDGHVGNRCSNYLSQSLPNELQKSTRSTMSGILSKEVILEVFNNTDQKWLESVKGKGIEDGSTALCVVLDGPELVVANCGDSRALLCQGGQTLVLTRDHVPTDNEEKLRIIKTGGSVLGGRLQGKLGVSRAFGNYEFKESRYLSSEPEINQLTLTPEVEFLVLGCDGLYEQFSNEEIVKFIKNGLMTHSLEEVIQELVAEAIDRGAEDNITIMVVKFSKSYKKLLKKKAKQLSKSSQNLLAFSKGKALRTSGKTAVKSPESISHSDPGRTLKKDYSLLRTSGKHPITHSSCPADPSNYFPIQLPPLPLPVDSKSKKIQESKKKKQSPSPPRSAKESKNIDVSEDKISKSHTGVKSIISRALTKSG